MYVELVSRCHYYSSIIFLTASPLVEQNRNIKSRLLILVSAFLSEKLLENIWNNIREGFFFKITFPLVKNYKPQNTCILHERKSVAAQYSVYIWK